jgi:hypothetical protein
VNIAKIITKIIVNMVNMQLIVVYLFINIQDNG